MITEISVRGYQSLYDVSLSIGRFTVIYGESDVGKSAFYRAIRGLLTAESGDSFISRGEKLAVVTIKLDSGKTLSWIKRKGQSSEYRLGASVYRRAKQIPQDMAKELGISPIIVDGERFYPSLRGQFDSLFLLFDSSLKRARVLGSLISNFLLQGVKQANLERNRNEADIRAAEDLRAKIEAATKLDWKKLQGDSTDALKTLDITKKMLERMREITKLLEDVREAERFKDFEAPEIDEARIDSIEVYIDRHIAITDLWLSMKRARNDVGLLDETVKDLRERLKDMFAEKDKMKVALTISCPKCGAPISLTEVGVE